MARIKFVHAADLHLDTPFKGLSNWNSALASRLKEATFRSFQNIIDLCLEEDVDFLLIAGDIFDSEDRSLAAQIKFNNELKRLTDNEIEVYFVCGNHDPLNSWLDALQFPEGAARFDASHPERKTFNKKGSPLADIYGVSYRDRGVSENLARRFESENSAAPFSIALLHGTVGSSGTHENYAPFSTEDVLNKKFDYWALGHIHQRRVVRAAEPAIVYPGNPQGRDFGETGERGCYLVDMEAGHDPQLRFIPTQQIRFEEVSVPLAGEKTIDELMTSIDEAQSALVQYDANCSYILRLTLEGRTPLHHVLFEPGKIDELLEAVNEDSLQNNPFIWIDRIRLRTQPEVDTEGLKKSDNFAAALLKTIEDYGRKPQALDRLLDDIVKNEMSNDVRRRLGDLSSEDREDILEQAKWMLLNQLLKEDG